MALFKQTIHDQNSVFNTTQKYVDEKMMVGLKEADQQLLQKLLMTPLTQSFASLIVPTQDEINKLWRIQAYQPFATHLGQKYPFHSGGLYRQPVRKWDKFLVKQEVLLALSKTL